MAERTVINLAERKKQRLLAQQSSLPTQVESIIPDFIDPPTINKMTDEQLDAMLNLIRINRLSATHIYNKNEKERKAINDEKLNAKMEKKSEQVYDELSRVLKYFDKLELRINELRALRLQSGLAFDPQGVDEEIVDDTNSAA